MTPRYDGYPFLETKIEGPLHHYILLPEEWTFDQLLLFARAQEAANRLSSCLVLSESRCLYIERQRFWEDTFLPYAEIAVYDKLQPAIPIEVPEHRRRHLRAYNERWNPGGFLLGEISHGGRPAKKEDIEDLSDLSSDGTPCSVWTCDECGEWKGETLYTMERGTFVVPVNCDCDNVHVCAACSRPLADAKVRGNRFDAETLTATYWAGFIALGHRCAA
jgi:hypothetical protein